MTIIQLTQEFDEDLADLIEFLYNSHPEDCEGLVEIILKSLNILTFSPEIGRPYRLPRRELIISRGKSGYLALYQYDAKKDEVIVQSIRHQRQAGYKRNR